MKYFYPDFLSERAVVGMIIGLALMIAALIILFFSNNVFAQAFNPTISYDAAKGEATLAATPVKGFKVTQIAFWCKNDKGEPVSRVVNLSAGGISGTVSAAGGLKNCRMQVAFENENGAVNFVILENIPVFIKDPTEGATVPPPVKPIETPPIGASTKECTEKDDQSFIKRNCGKLLGPLPTTPNKVPYCDGNTAVLREEYIYICANEKCAMDTSFSRQPCDPKKEQCVNGECKPKPAPTKKKTGFIQTPGGRGRVIVTNHSDKQLFGSIEFANGQRLLATLRPGRNEVGFIANEVSEASITASYRLTDSAGVVYSGNVVARISSKPAVGGVFQDIQERLRNFFAPPPTPSPIPTLPVPRPLF